LFIQAAEIKSEVEKKMRLERAEFERQKAEYEQKIAHLQALCNQLTVDADKVLQLIQQFSICI